MNGLVYNQLVWYLTTFIGVPKEWAGHCLIDSSFNNLATEVSTHFKLIYPSFDPSSFADGKRKHWKNVRERLLWNGAIVI